MKVIGRRFKRGFYVWLVLFLLFIIVFCWVWGCLVSGELGFGVLGWVRNWSFFLMGVNFLCWFSRFRIIDFRVFFVFMGVIWVIGE